MNKTKLSGTVMLLLATIIWGCAFSFQTMAKEFIQPFSLIGIRFLIAAILLFPFTFIHIRRTKEKINYKVGIIGGILIGVFLAAASIVQQYGLERTSTGKAGFLTAMYIIFVPMVAFVIFRKKTNILQILGILVTIAGVGIMSLNEEFKMNIGDILCVICGVLFSFEIMCVDYFSKKSDSIFLANVSFLTCGMVSLIFGLVLEDITFTKIQSAIWPILYLGIGSSGIAYSLQIFGQKRLNGVPASLIMCLESVFAALFAWILLKEIMSAKEIMGASLMMVGVVVVQVFDGWKSKKSVAKIEE